MSWAQRRRLLYILGIITFFVVFVVIPLFVHYYQAPTCFDKKQNGTEQGIDCGGSCDLLCTNQYSDLNVLWARFSKVDNGAYNVLAYIENPNFNAGANNVNYIFKLYDKAGILLRERTGQTFVPPNKVMAIFEPDLLTGNQIPARVVFSFTSEAVWLKQESVENGLTVSPTDISRLDSAPRLSTVVTNNTVNEIKKIEAVAILYDNEGNTVAFSRTVIDSIKGKQAQTVYFNWPKPFVGSYSRSEIVLRVLK